MPLFKPTRQKRALFFIFADALLIAAAIYVAFWLRFDGAVPASFRPAIPVAVVLIVAIKIPLLAFAGIYRVPWRYFSVRDFGSLALSSLAGSLIAGAVVLAGWKVAPLFPRSILAMEFFLSAFAMLLLRSSKRLFLELFAVGSRGEPTLIVGAGDSAETLVRGLQRSSSAYFPIAFLDDTGAKTGMRIQGLPVWPLTDPPASGATCAVIAIPDAQPSFLDPLFERLKGWGITTIKMTAPLQDPGAAPDLKDISIEDLLARHPKDLDTAAIGTFIRGKRLLITGAGGSIGSEIVRQCLAYGAAQIVALDHSEYNLYALVDELRDDPRVVPVMQSVVDRDTLEATYRRYTPQIVIHAAAYKHVPLAEANTAETVRNNVVGTKNAIDLALEYGIEKFVLISTDKAVRPTNVMGTTKRICELYAQNANADKRRPTEIVAVRFGNVLGSSGSVIPKFRTQIEAGGPVTVTHPDITRYFMLIPEACQLVLQAAAIGEGGEIFILDMGEPVKIADMARRMIELAGKPDIPIVYTGLRPGEKLYEELLIDDAEAKTAYESIMVAHPTVYPIATLNSDIARLCDAAAPRAVLTAIVPEASLTPDDPA